MIFLTIIIYIAVLAAVIGLFVLAMRSFWASKIITGLSAIASTVFGVIAMINSENEELLLEYAFMWGIFVVIALVFMAGSDAFDSNTEGTYLIFGTLFEDTNHPVKAFFYMLLGIALITLIVGLIAYFWTFIIGLIMSVAIIICVITYIVLKIKGEEI
ncbi:MAG: hypothetical protein IJF38_01135 [Clostridia bacterium]|nr:hypothetical protein [Clostridia bacterium]